MDVAADELLTIVVVLFGGGDAIDVDAMLEGLEAGAGEMHRLIEMLLHEDVDGLSADMLHEVGQKDESQVAV